MTDIDMKKAFAIAEGYVAAADQADNFLPPPKEDIELLCRALITFRPTQPTWRETVRAAADKKGGALTFDELLLLAKDYKMTPEEIEAQRQSWCRQDMD